MSNTLNHIAGWQLFSGLVLTVSNQFANVSPIWLEGTLVWSAGIILFFKLAQKQKLIISALGGFALLSWLVAWQTGDASQLLGALTMNQSMIVMLMGVQFLQLVAMPDSETKETLPTGKNAFLKTYWGLHLFGSVINMSAVILVADRLTSVNPLTKQQQVLLTRAFTSAASWSPFFAAFAAAMVFAPDASLTIVIMTGLGLACAAFLITYADVMTQNEITIDKFVGYPMRFQALWLPAVLAIMVMSFHELMPDIKVILLIALLSVLISGIVLFFRAGLRVSSKGLLRQIHVELPSMKNEISLFLIAGVFGAGLAAVLDNLSINVPFVEFDGVVASLVMLTMFVLALFGVHPIVSIAVIGHWISTTEPNQTLLAMTFLMSWALCVSTSPMSGINLALHGRYGVSGREIFSWNLPYAIKMYLIACVMLLLTSYFLGIGQ
ncbi:MAG: hypothetical protein ABGX33_01805 [Cycloclasticus sp.]